MSNGDGLTSGDISGDSPKVTIIMGTNGETVFIAQDLPIMIPLRIGKGTVYIGTLQRVYSGSIML